MKKTLIRLGLCLFAFSNVAFAQTKTGKQTNQTFKISTEQLKDKIKGGWAGQTIGVTFGGPTEFKFNGTMIQDYQPIAYYDGYLKKTMTEWPDLYDDIYMDLAFVKVLDEQGFDAPATAFAKDFANAKYNLWHANQAARHNILKGIMPPMSGHWTNNPHADDIDFQIEADFSGLMSPGMPNAGIALADKIGHIMNYGDGWYGGVFVGAMYSVAFTSNDVNYIVEEALKTIPQQSTFYKCINDVVQWHKKYPNDWKQTWFEIQRKWTEDKGCPEGVFAPLNIDAKVNSAYIVLGLLYGKGDFTKTLEIATRAGQDSDCNPSSAGGILGTVLGYDKIPSSWKVGLKEVEEMDFKWTTMSLNDVYATSYKHALEMVRRNGGKVTDKEIIIAIQKPATVRLEQSFEGLNPISKLPIKNISQNKNEIVFNFTGNGFALRGEAARKAYEYPEYNFETELYIDGKKVDDVKLPTSFLTRRYDLFWTYGLENKEHQVKIIIKNPDDKYEIRVWDNIVYAPKQKV